MNRLGPPPPGTWRRDDGSTGFLPDGGIVSPVSAVSVQAIVPPARVGPEMAPCPYCDKFEYEAQEGAVSADILAHLKDTHPAIWEEMRKDVAQETEKIEVQFL